MSLCKRVRSLRGERGLTQTGLAERAGVSRRTIAEIELTAGANPTRATLEGIADALGVTVSDLVRTDDEVRAVAS